MTKFNILSMNLNKRMKKIFKRKKQQQNLNLKSKSLVRGLTLQCLTLMLCRTASHLTPVRSLGAPGRRGEVRGVCRWCH